MDLHNSRYNTQRSAHWFDFCLSHQHHLLKLNAASVRSAGSKPGWGQPWLRRAWILLPFLISIVRDLMHWTSLHCFVTLHQDADYADAFLESLTEKLAGILLFVAINDKLFTLLEADSNWFFCVTIHMISWLLSSPTPTNQNYSLQSQCEGDKLCNIYLLILMSKMS